jgi:hypothetical protein
VSKEIRTPQRDAGSSQAWRIVVRFADGSGAYYYVDERHQDDRGKTPERWGRESQAHRFLSEGEARRVASGMQTSSAVREYLVVRLAPGRNPSRSGLLSCRPAPTQRS